MSDWLSAGSLAIVLVVSALALVLGLRNPKN